jgi:putative SOS response-associated peptidase YedK
MCGRFPQSKSIERYMHPLSGDWCGGYLVDAPPTWNVAPSKPSWIIRYLFDELQPARLKWGYRSSTPNSQLAPTNARVETASTNALFRDAWKKRRCLVPADGWYEWREENRAKQPYYFTRADEQPCYFAGLWLGDGFCMCTTAADGELATIHGRKPLSLTAQDAREWVSDPVTAEDVMRRAVPASAFRFFPVSKAVNNWRSDGPQLIEEQRPQSQPQKELW